MDTRIKRVIAQTSCCCKYRLEDSVVKQKTFAVNVAKGKRESKLYSKLHVQIAVRLV